jgi:cytochrome c oxidase subunit 3
MDDKLTTGADSPEGVGSFGLSVLLAALGVLFLGSLVAVWWLHDDPAMWPNGLPALPQGLWLSTALLVALSVAMHRKLLRVAFGLSLMFLAAQAWNWTAMLADLPKDVQSLYTFHFYMLTLLHAVHVLGGVIWHIVGLAKPTAATTRLLTTYWDFLGVVWVLLIANLLLVRVPHELGSPISVGTLALFAISTAVSAGYWLQSQALLWERGEKGFVVFGVFFPPFAYLQVWGRAEELGTERLAARWGLVQGIWLVILIFVGGVHADWMRGLES